jgi:two-component system chemotaxis sensor kinase CheA
VTLRAEHAGGAVVVTLSDDGRGLDRERIARKAVERGLIESDRGMSDAEVYALIFAPGFSTAETLTDVSGRGVGMDVVKRNIDSVRGRIEIAACSGRGPRSRCASRSPWR